MPDVFPCRGFLRYPDGFFALPGRVFEHCKTSDKVSVYKSRRFLPKLT